MSDKRSSAQAPRGPTRQRRRRRGAPLGVALPSIQEVNVGRRLRELRKEHGLSIRALAEKSGLNVNTLSLIENGKTSPSVSTLQRIAVALQTPITSFFETGVPRNSVAHIRAGSRPRAAFAHGTLEDLGAGLSEHAVEPFVVTLGANADSGAHPIVHTGHEFVFCLQGHIAYTIEEHAYLLEAGDSLLFESRLPHRWQNVDTTPSQAILVLCPSDERDRPTEQHFREQE
jgi:transcriptional regulator with XRE-family HTH domain